MKTKKRILNLCILLLMGTSLMYAQSKKEKQTRQKQELKEVIDSKEYEVTAQTAYPQTGKSIPLTSAYSLKIKNDSVFSWLPYYGRAYSVPYGGGKGLTFEAPIRNYEVNYTSKGVANVKINTRTDEDSYEFYLKVYPGGSSSIQVNMINRQSIQFMGELNKEGKK